MPLHGQERKVMDKKISLSLATIILSIMLISCHAETKIDQIAPNFKANTATAKTITLNQYRGKIIVLEWFNAECPFVGKMYKSGKMQHLQKTYTRKNVIWLRIISSAKDKQGYMTPAQLQKNDQLTAATPTATILDAKGIIGKLYQAKTTPEMYIINQNGILVYRGAIDSIPSTAIASIAQATNYVEENLDSLLNGQSVKISQSKPYGCSVKY